MIIPLVSLTTLFLLSFPSIYYNLYLDHVWFDPVRHFLGGFFVAMLFAHYLKDYFLNSNKIKNILIIVSVTLFVGVLWEFSEYIASQLLAEPLYRYYGIRAYFMGDLQDTMNDLLIDILGSFTFTISHLFWSRDTHQFKAYTKDNRDGLA